MTKVLERFDYRCERGQCNIGFGACVQHAKDGARMYASHSWSVCAHSIVQRKWTSLMLAARYNKSAQALAVAARLLKAGADVNAADRVTAWEGYDVGCHMFAVTVG